MGSGLVVHVGVESENFVDIEEMDVLPMRKNKRKVFFLIRLH